MNRFIVCLMPVDALQHVNIRCADVERSREFYERLGLRVGARPAFSSRGYWMYLGAEPVVHLVQLQTDPLPQGGAIDHVAFGATDVAATTAALRAAQIEFTIRPADGMTQVFVHDPDGVKVELNFS